MKRILINKASKETLTQFSYCIVKYNELKKEVRSYLSINEDINIHDDFFNKIICPIFNGVEEMINNGNLKELSTRYSFHTGDILEEIELLSVNKLPKNNKVPFNEFTNEIYNSITEIINDTFFDAIEIINEIKSAKE